jgi:hypothetical protein
MAPFGLRLPSPFRSGASIGLTPYPDSLYSALERTTLVPSLYVYGGIISALRYSVKFV